MDDQLLASTGAGLKWISFTNTNTTYDFAASGAAQNDVRLRLTAGGSGSGTDEVVIQGAGDTTVNLSGNVITVSSTDADTKYDFTSVAVTSGVAFQLVGTDSTTDAVNLIQGSNIEIDRDGNDITISTILSGTVTGPSSSTDGAIVLFDGTAGNLLKDSSLTVDSGGDLTTAGAITTASGTASLITFRYDQTGSFPNANSYQGAVAYSDNNNAMYFASGNSWYQLARLIDIVPNTNTTYSIALTGSNSGLITLADSNGLTDSLQLLRNTYGGVELTRNSDNLYFDSRLYNISAETANGNAASLRLSGVNHDISGSPTTTTTDNISFAGADGITVTRSDADTITIGAPGGVGGSSYTDSNAKDAAAQSITNGTHVGISFTYDQQNQILNSIVTASGSGGSGGTAVLYDFYGTNLTSNQVILNLDPSTGTNDTVEFAGAGGTTVSWDSLNKKATIQSDIPLQSDWNNTDINSLEFIQNKPTIPPAYTLPVATTSVLGGVIPDGTTITVDGNGNIAAIPGGYTLPIASSTVLGGIKIGAGLSIDAGGVVTVASGGSVGLQARQDFSGTTSSLADNTTENLNITAYKAYTLLKVQTDADAWVRIYTDAAARTADSTRSEGADPSPGSGIIAEIRGSGVVRMSPAATGYNNDSPSATDTVYTAVTNRSGSATTITVTLTAIRLEA